jgi:hypothetical protein
VQSPSDASKYVKQLHDLFPGSWGRLELLSVHVE